MALARLEVQMKSGIMTLCTDLSALENNARRSAR